MKITAPFTTERWALTGSPFGLFANLPDGDGQKSDGAASPFAVGAVTTGLLIASLIPNSNGFLMPVICAAILMIGMPHGMFDYLYLKRLSQGNWRHLAGLVAGYLAVAALVWTMWQAQPLVALAAFIALSVYHFAEDWIRYQSQLGSIAMALSVIALPVVLYRDQIAHLFSIVGGPQSYILADFLLLFTPVFALVALANVAIDWAAARHREAKRNAMCIAASLFLPPGLGFAVYFCACHSPAHFAESYRTFFKERPFPLAFFVGMAIASAAVIFAVLLMQPLQQIDQKLIATTFQTLAILTVPHLLLSLWVSSQER